MQASLTPPSAVTNNRSVVSNVSNHFSVDKVIASGTNGRSITGDLAREAKARAIRVA